ncbi:hypothetical protein PHAVU_005G165700 [Phaseolus vulgaris]|uniref:Uncharacterized protein n=1 Tax=Phaseolus vulgaris TaxID=3885 RepID=V7BZW1_PHAVU|nr:hypothetical protein PHAVU_005G165700g [Phaseolus vulgaris]ESW22595.1 hypothetical protein PHAVU_005G165700g [Phaseolus vulgaris]
MKNEKKKEQRLKLFVRFRIDRTNPYGDEHESNGKERVRCRSDERVKERECRTEQNRGDKIMGSACFYFRSPANMDHANPLPPK